MKRILLLTLVLMLMLAQAASADYYEGLNLESSAPVVNGEPVTLTFAIAQSEIQGDADGMWFFEYVRRALNVNLDVTQVASAQEYKQLVFASGDLPDIMMLGVTAAELMTYGASEGLIRSLDEFITPELMPNLTNALEENPNARKTITAADGHIYSLGAVGAPNEGNLARVFLNRDWLADAGIETPTTLDEFTAMLYAFKSRGEDIVPMAGGYNAINPGLALLTAYGYNTNDPKGLSVALRNGEVVFPYGDREAYGAYLKTMNQYYADGLISQNFYTTDATSVRALMAEGVTGVIAEPAFLSVPNAYKPWWAMKPLTSELNAEPVWFAHQSYTAGTFVVSAECALPEVAMRFADYCYDQEAWFLLSQGPTIDQPELMYDLPEVIGWYWDAEERMVTYEDLDLIAKYGSGYNYALARIKPFTSTTSFGYYTLASRAAMYGAEKYLGLPYTTELNFNLDLPDPHYRASVVENLLPYAQLGYPNVVYFDEVTNDAITNLKSVLETYVQTETAKFVTGQRSLTEIDMYFDALDDLGYQEYLGYYADYYSAIN